MEIVGAASSILTITAAVGQGVTITKRLHDLLEDIRDAPGEVKQELESLKLLASSLRSVEECGRSVHRYDPALSDAVRRRHDRVQELELFFLGHQSDLQSERTRKRYWGALRIVWKAKQIEKLKRSCDRARAELSLAIHISIL